MNKAAMVRIAMAIGAFLKPNIGISRSAVGAWRMTFFARHLRMRSGQRIAGFGVIERSYFHGLPVSVIMALEAILTEPSFVAVLVTGHAARGEAQKSPAQIMHFYLGSFCWNNVFGIMAAVTGQRRMFTFQDIAGLLVIESPGVPLDERKIFSVVLRVTANALLT